MAITPYERRIGVPGPQAGDVSPTVDTRMPDIGPALSNLGQQIRAAFEPQLRIDALQRARDDAGRVTFERDENGNPVLPENARGGLIYAQAFDGLLQNKYKSQVTTGFEKRLDDNIGLRRTGDAEFSASDFANFVDGQVEGTLAAVDPRMRVEIEEVLRREAQQRLAAFSGEVTRTKRQQVINGTLDQIRVLQGQVRNWRDLGLSAESALEKTRQIAELGQGLVENGMAGDLEADALFMQSNQDSEGIQRYVDGIELTNTLTLQAAAMVPADLLAVEYALKGRVIPGAKLTGLTLERNIGTDVVTPDLLEATHLEMFGVEVTSSIRPDDHPLSKANAKSLHKASNGGRAIDVPKIDGMEIEDLVAAYKAMGFNVVHFQDEYKNPSRHATGGHWHLAFGGTRSISQVVENPEMTQTRLEQIAALAPEHRDFLLGVVQDARQKQAEDLRFAKQQALVERQLREQAEVFRQLGESIEAGYDTGTMVGYNTTGKPKQWLREEFRAQVDVAGLGRFDPKAMGQAVAWIQKRTMIPEEVIAAVDLGVRSPDNWRGALSLYRTISNATTTGGSRLGDILTNEFDPRTRALLDYADRMETLGVHDEKIAARLERISDPNNRAFTIKAAIEAADEVFVGNGDDRYEDRRNEALRETFGDQRTVLDRGMVRDVDALFAANLDLVDRDPERALQLAIMQTQNGYDRSSLFATGSGPKALINLMGTPAKTSRFIMDWLSTETDAATGKPLLRRVEGGTHRLGGPRPSVRLVPVDGSTRQIGWYRVIVTDPRDRSRIIDDFEVDLGKELRQHGENVTRAATTRDPIKDARENRSFWQNMLVGIGRSADHGPKY